MKETPVVEENFDGDPYYDFEEIDEEEEILPPVEENKMPDNSTEKNWIVETDEATKADLQMLIAEDMAIIRGNSWKKNVFRKNIIAIRTLKNIERENRTATPEELEILKAYVGFGGIPKAFDKDDENWKLEALLLQSILTEKEYREARASTLNAHYTSGEIIQKMYEGLSKLGFHQGTILSRQWASADFSVICRKK
mgnify:CR=1 FL=1